MGDAKLMLVAGVDGDSGAAAAVCSSARTSGFSKSHATPCLRQLPHRGWTSSHCRKQKQGGPSQWKWNGMNGKASRVILPQQRRQKHTLILRDLHRRQPDRDFLWERRGGIFRSIYRAASVC